MPSQRKAIEITLKQQAIDWIESEGGGVPSRAEPHFRRLGWRVSASAYRKWWRDRNQIRAESVARFRLIGGGRKPLAGAVEDALMDLLYDKRVRKEKVTREWIASTAADHFRASRTEEEHEEHPIRFVASNPWVYGFMKRNNLTLRKRTNLTTLTDDELVDRAVAYTAYLSEHKASMTRDRTILTDETAVYFEDARTHTVDEIGARHVVIRSTGFSSMRITAALAVTASGKKLPPYLIWKRKTRGPIERVGGCYVAYQERAWVDQDLLIDWLNWYFPTVAKTTGKYVIWDSMRAHIAKKVKQRCREQDVGMTVIPGGLTPYLQAGDVGIYKSFKDNLCKIINEWKHSDNVRYTRGGNPRPPDVELVSAWVVKAWRQMKQGETRSVSLAYTSMRFWGSTPDSVVEKSVSMCGFSDESTSWHIARHDVYGTKFRMAWELRGDNNVDSDNDVDSDDESFEDLMETLDDIVIED